MAAMEQHTTNGATHRLEFSGVLDIFESKILLTESLDALNDPSAESISIDLQGVERMDVTAVQIVRSLCRAADTKGLPVSISAPPTLVEKLKAVGLSL